MNKHLAQGTIATDPGRLTGPGLSGPTGKLANVLIPMRIFFGNHPLR
jgi:hypothetical protein